MSTLPRINNKSVKNLHNNSQGSNQTSRYRKLRNIKTNQTTNDSVEIKNWMKSMVEKSLKLGHDLGYIKQLMIKSREKERMEKNLLNIKKNIKIVKLRGRPRRKGLSNSYLKNSSMHNLTHNFSDYTFHNCSKIGIEHPPAHYVSAVDSQNNSKMQSETNSPTRVRKTGDISKDSSMNFHFTNKEPLEKLKEGIKMARDLKEYIKNDMKTTHIDQQKRYKRVRKKLREKLLEIRRMGLTLEEFKTKDIYPRKPFSRPLSYELIKAAKMDELDMVKVCVKENPWIVFDYDHIGLTAMHWACKRNNTDIGLFLLKETKLNVNSKDLLNRPPLYYAVQNKNIPLVRGLLLNRANPWSSTLGYDYLDVCEKDVRIVYLIQRFRNIDMLSSLTDIEDRKKIWERQTQDLGTGTSGI